MFSGHTVGSQCTFSWMKRIFGEHFHFMMYKGSFFFSFLFYVFLSSHISLLMLYLLNNLSVLLGEMQSWPCKNKMYLQSEPVGSERLIYGSVFRLKPRHFIDSPSWLFVNSTFAYLLECICDSKINTHRAFVVIWGQGQTEKSESPDMHVCSQLRSNRVALLVSTFIL